MRFWRFLAATTMLAVGLVAGKKEETHEDATVSMGEMEAFVQYMQDYDKPYRLHADNHPLFIKRFNAFRQNLKRIDEHNAKYHRGEVTFTLGLNQLADLADEEYRQLLGYKKSKSAVSTSAQTFEIPKNFNMSDIPDSWDWREHDAVTPVKNQGMCGSCWAFSAVASMESAYARASGELQTFSEQELVDCCDGGMDTCNRGGEMSHGFIEIIDHHSGKTESENDYKYTATSKGKCLADDSKGIGHFTAYVNVTSGDENALKVAVAKNCVISVAIDASSFMFQLYRHGVFSWPLCKNGVDELDHGVALVGYGVYKKKEFWLVKNSWAESWGMHGYIMMSRNKNNQCGIATDASYPITSKQTVFTESVSIM